MSKMTVCLVTNAKEETAACTKGMFPNCQLLLLNDKEMLDLIGTVNVLVPGHINVGADLIRQARQLKLIHCGTGYNNVDLDAASECGVYVAVTPNVAATSVAELVFASFLAMAKKIVEFDNLMKGGGWKTTDFFGMPELKGKTLGIVGFGNIGKEVAKIGRGFGMRIVAHDPYVQHDQEGSELLSLDDLLRQADFITLHVLLNKDTNKLIGAKELASMKPTAIIANASRGPVIDQSALTDALRQRKIAGACLDVFEKEPLAADSPLRKLPNVLLTPHIAYCSDEALSGRYQFFADNCARLLRGETPRMAVNERQVRERAQQPKSAVG
jgi:phosphoglycerate dehydrogenase-like enzyme